MLILTCVDRTKKHCTIACVNGVSPQTVWHPRQGKLDPKDLSYVTHFGDIHSLSRIT